MLDHGIGGVEALVILLIVIVVFGSKRLPDSARALGRSLRIFKAETKGLQSEDDQTSALLPTGARFDPMTGQPLRRFDAYTGALLDSPLIPSTPPSPESSSH